MLLTLTLTADTPIKELTRKGLTDVPRVVREQFGLHGLNISTALLKGADRAALVGLRDAADRAGCACLVLIEPPLTLATDKPKQADAALDRCARLVAAASALGCNSLALGVEGPATDAAFECAVENLRRVSSLAEGRDLNVLIAPTEGLTAEPDRVTELIKRVGGFRIGTYPDFETAAAAPDPIAYLRRLVPYAWAISASTLEFVEIEAEAEPAPPAKKPAAAESRSEPEADAEAGEDEDGIDDLDFGDEDEGPLPPPPEHVPYDLREMIQAVSSVGYDGTLSIDYRGEDVTLGIRQSCDALQDALDHLSGG